MKNIYIAAHHRPFKVVEIKTSRARETPTPEEKLRQQKNILCLYRSDAEHRTPFPPEKKPATVTNGGARSACAGVGTGEHLGGKVAVPAKSHAPGRMIDDRKPLRINSSTLQSSMLLPHGIVAFLYVCIG